MKIRRFILTAAAVMLSLKAATAQEVIAMANEYNVSADVSNLKVGTRFTGDDTDLIWSVKLLKRTFEHQRDNFVVSPLSVYFATDLLANGADGDNLQEIMSGILTTSSDYGIDDINANLEKYLNHMSSAFEVHNSVWADEIKRQYVDTVQNKLKADVKKRPDSTDFINNWINKKTHGRISKLLQSQETSEGTIYLVNTTYFKDDWVQGFDKEHTQEADFHSFKGSTDKVNMMYEKMLVEYYEDDMMQAIRLPYKKGDTMQIFLPKDNFADFIKNLDAEKLKIPYRYKNVHIYLPRFEIDYKNDNMAEDFKYFGLQAAFDEQRTDLFPKLSNIPHYVAQIVHQANIKLDEKGTVASAATATFGYAAAVARPDKDIFRADKPFIFMIDNGAFIGAYLQGNSN